MASLRSWASPLATLLSICFTVDLVLRISVVILSRLILAKSYFCPSPWTRALMLLIWLRSSVALARSLEMVEAPAGRDDRATVLEHTVTTAKMEHIHRNC